MLRWIGVVLVLAAAGWLSYAAFRFLGSPYPDRGMWISVPMDTTFHFEHGTLRSVSGSLRAIDYSPWWLPSILASIAVLLVLALRGCVRRQSNSRP